MTALDLAELFGDLAEVRRWVGWRYETRGGEETKVPKDPHTGRNASSTDPATWGTLAEATYIRDERDLAGVGIVLGDGLGGIDLDACRDPETGELTSWAQTIIRGFRSYAEVSPSATGVKILAWGAPEELPASSIPRAGPSINGKAPAIECYVHGRYFTVTGQLLDDVPAEIVDAGDPGGPWDRMVGLLRKRAGGGGRANGRTHGSSVESWIHALENGGPVHDSAMRLVGRWVAKGLTDAEIRAMMARIADRVIQKRGAGRAGALMGSELDRMIEGARKKEYDVDTETGEVLGGRDTDVDVSLDDFRAYLPEHRYIFVPSRDLWPASSVNGRIPPVATGRQKDNGEDELEAASKWLDRERPVEQWTWAPGEPQLIEGRLVSHGGWIDVPGVTVFNLYRPPRVTSGEVEEASPWVEHVHRVYPAEADHIIRWLAHRVQRPGEKINHALVMGGLQGIGKDTLLEPVKYAVGPWNFVEVSPSQLTGRFNGFLKSVILRVSEARDLGDVDRYSFYEHMKAFTAAPPDVLRIDEKHRQEYSVFNVCGCVLTTNHKAGGIYLPDDDRRHYVAWSELSKDDFTPEYWNGLWGWYGDGGTRHVAVYLHDLDLSGFNPKAPPPKTAAFWEVVDASRAPEDAELADALDKLQGPDAVTLANIRKVVAADFSDWLGDRRNRTKVPHRMEKAGYTAVRNDTAKDGLWKIGGRRQVVYGRRGLSRRERLTAANTLVAGSR